MKNLVKVVFATFFACNAWVVHGQYAIGDMDLDRDLATWYDHAMKTENLPVLEGTFYPLPHITSKEGPYFKSNRWAEGSVVLAGEKYENLFLLYNVFDDLLILRNMALKDARIESMLPNQKKVEAFNIHGHQFVRLTEPLVPRNGIGFYELFFDGDSIDFFIKKTKIELLQDRKVVFKNEDQFFFYDGQQFVKYKSKKSIYRHFPEIKAKLKPKGSFLNMNLKNNEREGMWTWLNYADGLLSEE
ncbi:hypothetical protein [Reichenbachiella sp.]|uniref:hypothetical protein n=1 Tax=Reichenbachiella sp. TaxID=2184521 RepID=UPI003BB03B64